jgi:hypothetical protein
VSAQTAIIFPANMKWHVTLAELSSIHKQVMVHGLKLKQQYLVKIFFDIFATTVQWQLSSD